MAFESATLRPVGMAVPTDAISAWMADHRAAWRDPHGTGTWHLSGSAAAAGVAKAAREADPRRFPPGVVVRLMPDRIELEALADRDAEAQIAALLGSLLAAGSWTVARDGEAVTPLLAPEQLVRGAPGPRPDAATGIRVLWRVGEADRPGGCRQLEVDNRGAAAFVHTQGATARRVSGWLDPAARLAWLEAAAHLDRDDDELTGVFPGEQVACVRVETPTDEWSLWFEAARPPPSVRPLAAVAGRWLGRFEGEADFPRALGDDEARATR